MNRLVEKLFTFAVSQTETFENPMSPQVNAIGSIIAAIVVLFLLCLFGQYLWNNALCPLVSVARPANSIFQILGVAILLSLLSP